MPACKKFWARRRRKGGRDEDRTEVVSLYNWVKKAFLAHGGAQLQCTVGDVLLLLLRVYTKEELANLSPSELSEKLDALWDDVLALQKSDPVQVSDKPAAPKQTGLLDFILPGKHTAPSHLKVAFVHERTPSTSSWTSQHEFGRTQLDTVFEGKVETAAYFNAVPGKNADALVEQAITDGADVVFTTSPQAGRRVPARRRPAPAGTHPELLDGDALRQHPHLLHPRV